MAEAKREFKGLEELMAEEIRQYNLLIEELKEEGKELRQNSVESLTKSINKIEEQRRILAALHEAVGKELKRATNSLELREEILARSLPGQIYQKWQRHQREIARLKERARQLNLQNKTFIQKVLSYWKEIRQLIANSGNNASYIWANSNQETKPLFLNRQV